MAESVQITRSVALVGRPNVGKSRLFNRLVGRRVSIVHDQPGVTRDIVSEEVNGDYLLMDTGGLGSDLPNTPKVIAEAVAEQVDFAIQAAALVLFVVDAVEGLTVQDEQIAVRLRRFRKRTVLVANKVDHAGREGNVHEFLKLGFGEPIAVSAEHGVGERELREAVEARLGPKPEAAPAAEGGAEPVEAEAKEPREADRTRICLAGRPNVGKSSLGNALLKSERLIVSEVPGTTRDAVRVDLDYPAPNGDIWKFQLIDTAGRRQANRVDSSVEYFSALRSSQAMVEADVVFLVLDAMEGVTKQDKMLAGEVMESGPGLAVVVNKWDYALKKFAREPLPGYENEADFRKAFVKAVRRELFFLPDSPVIFTSAKEGIAVEEILKKAREIMRRVERPLPTGQLNRVLQELVERNPPHFRDGRRFKIYYALQTGKQPFRIRIYCNQAGKLEEGYRRYLETGVLAAFDLKGCPVRFELVGKPKQTKAGGRGKKGSEEPGDAAGPLRAVED